MFGIKTFFKQQARAFLLQRPRHAHFPKKELSLLALRKIIKGISNELAKDNNVVYLDTPGVSWANRAASLVWEKLVSFNPNNLGNWTLSNSPAGETTKIEAELIAQLINLYKADARRFTGSVSSGSTEGNLFAVWAGRNYLQQHTKIEKIVLLKTDLTHYSISKCADIAQVQTKTVGLSPKTWAMTGEEFEQTVLKLRKKGFEGFLVPLTLGYTASGTSDPLDKILQKIDSLKRRYKNLHFFVWCDAALQGLVLPFIKKSFQPFKNKNVQLLTVDFHKFPGVPYPASVVLYQKKLAPLITRNIPYLDQKDVTVLGSRPGISAVAIWATIHHFGAHKFKKRIQTALMQKKKFLEFVTAVVPSLEIISDPESIQALLIVNGRRIPEEICQKYGLVLRKYSLLFSNGKKEIYYYKLFFFSSFR